MRLKHLLILISIFILMPSADAAVHIEASLNPAVPSVGEPVELIVAVIGAGERLRQPQLPPISGFTESSKTHSEETSVSGGQSMTRTIFSYTLIPKTEGQFTIPSIDVRVGSVTYKTGQIEGYVQSVGQASSYSGARNATVVPASSNSLPDEFLTNQETFIRAWVDKDEVYINEPVTITYTLYTRVSATYKGFDNEPVTTGFWVEDFPSQGAETRHKKTLGQYQYLVADVRSLALFPLSAGTFTLDPGSLKVDVQITKGDPFDQFYSRQVFGRQRMSVSQRITEIQPRILKTEPIQIKAKELPKKGMPEGFLGAVGQYDIHASLDASSIDAGEAVTHSLVVSGKGNLTTLEMPQLKTLQGFSMYDGSKTVSLNKDRMLVEGEKRVDTVLIPLEPGRQEVPAVKFVYFDTRTEQYVTKFSESFSLNVTGTPASDQGSAYDERIQDLRDETREQQPTQAVELPSDLPKPKDQIGSASIEGLPRLTEKSLWQFLATVAAAPLILLIFCRLLALMFRAPSTEKKHQIAKSTAKKRLRSAAALLKVEKRKEFLNALSAGVTDYFAGRFKIGRGSVGATLVSERLNGKLPDEDIKRVVKVFKDIDYARFSTASISESEMKKLYDEADELLRYMENKRI